MGHATYPGRSIHAGLAKSSDTDKPGAAFGRNQRTVLGIGERLPIAIEQPTASRRPERASNSSHGTHHEQLNSQGREGTRRTQRTAGGLFFASFAFLRGLGSSFSLGIVSDRAPQRRTRERFG